MHISQINYVMKKHISIKDEKKYFGRIFCLTEDSPPTTRVLKKKCKTATIVKSYTNEVIERYVRRFS